MFEKLLCNIGLHIWTWDLSTSSHKIELDIPNKQRCERCNKIKRIKK